LYFQSLVFLLGVRGQAGGNGGSSRAPDQYWQCRGEAGAAETGGCGLGGVAWTRKCGLG